MRFSSALSPQTDRARWNTRASPIRKLREIVRTSGSSSARTAISGPMPAGSPIVTARTGLCVMSDASLDAVVMAHLADRRQSGQFKQWYGSDLKGEPEARQSTGGAA